MKWLRLFVVLALFGVGVNDVDGAGLLVGVLVGVEG